MENLINKTFFTAKEAENEGVSRRMLSHYLKKGKIERVSRGVYRHVDSNLRPEDSKWLELAVIAKRLDGVICLISALNFYEMTDEFMKEYWIAVPNDFSRIDIKNTRIIRMRNIDSGVVKINLCGRDIKIFDVEKTIIDSFRLLDIETATRALKAYFKSSRFKTNIRKLNKYAKEHRVDISDYITALTT